ANSSEAFAARRLLATRQGATTMRRVCSCGSPFLRLFDDLGCVGCGQQCCRGCAVVIESAAYCVQCADALAVSVELFDPDPAPSSAARRREAWVASTLKLRDHRVGVPKASAELSAQVRQQLDRDRRMLTGEGAEA